MKIRVKSAAVMHDRVSQKVGTVLDLNEDSAKRLIKLGVAEAVDNTLTPPHPTGSKDGEKDNTTPLPTAPALDVDNMTRDELAQELSVRGILFKKTASRDELATLFRETAAKQ